MEYFQAFNYLCSEMMMIKYYEDVPFVIFDKKIASVMAERLPKMEEKLKNYSEGDFSNNRTTMYKVIEDIIKASSLF